jgi:hypothetical protein
VFVIVLTRRRGISDRQLKLEMRFPVGVSLLAMAVCQATSMLIVMPSSRAGSLPQLIGVVRKVCERHKISAGAAEGCDLLMLLFKVKIKRSQPSAAPTGSFDSR